MIYNVCCLAGVDLVPNMNMSCLNSPMSLANGGMPLNSVVGLVETHIQSGFINLVQYVLNYGNLVTFSSNLLIYMAHINT